MTMTSCDPHSGLTGLGFFQNVGRTRRQGIEAEVNLTSNALQLYASYALLDARFLDALELGSDSPFADAVTGTIQVVPGNQISRVPRNRVKFNSTMRHRRLESWRRCVVLGSQYFVGDGSNQVPSFRVYRFQRPSSYQINRLPALRSRRQFLDDRYSTYGTFFDTTDVPNFTNGGAQFTDPRSVSPARPRAFYVGLKATF